MFISYANSDGRELASRLVPELQRRHHDVSWDGDLNRINPLCVLSWIETQIRIGIVLLVMSRDYIRAAESGDFTERLGVRYELRLVRDKLYHHRGDRGCPIVVVLPPGVPVRDVPAVFRGLAIRTFDPRTGAGIEELVEAIDVLSESGLR